MILVGVTVLVELDDEPLEDELLEDELPEDEALAAEELPEAVEAGPTMVVVVVVVVVVLDPATHFPLTRMSPSLLEQLLQPTPPSL